MGLLEDVHRQLEWRISTFFLIGRIKLERSLVRLGLCTCKDEVFQRAFQEGYRAGCEDTKEQMKGRKRFVHIRG